MTPKLRESIGAVHQLLVRASLNYDIWWAYKSKDTRPVYAKTMNQYLAFFSSGIHAHFLAYVAAMYAMYETRKDTYNCNQLLKVFAAEPGVTPQKVSEVKAVLAEAKPIWVKVGILRNEVFGHMAANSSTTAAFTKAAVKPNELVHLLDLSKQILNIIRSAVGSGQHAYNLAAWDDTLRLLNHLKARSDA